MRQIQFILLSIILTLPLSAQQGGDSLFGSSVVHEIRITFSQNNWWDTLTYNYEQSNSQNLDFYIPGTVTIDGDFLDSVGVRLKGNASYGNPGMKKPLKLSFDEYISGQRYDGLKSIHLNNAAYDPTMLREKLMLDVLNRHHLAAPRCTFAAVYFNNGYVGLYKIIETIDKTFLQTNFNDNDGNLFKGDPYGTLAWIDGNESSYYPHYELKTNETANDWSDLVDLIDRINNSGAYFPSQIESRFAVDDYLWTLAANNLFVNLDSYLFNPHNYYIYDDSLDGKFHWISWDVGLAFGVFPLWWQSRTTSLEIFYLSDSPENVPLNVQLFKHENYKRTYLNAMCTYLNEDFSPWKLFPKIDSLANRIRPFVYSEPDTNRMYSTEQFEGNLGFSSYSVWIASNIPGLKSFVSDRRTDVQNQLCTLGWSCASGNEAHLIVEPAIRIFPNPGSSKVTVFFDSPEENVLINYHIYDLLGKVVFEENSLLENARYERTLDFTSKPPGVYVMKVKSLCSEIQQKIVIVH